MESNGAIPFDIAARLTDKRTIAFVASKNGESLATERYTVGDGKRRSWVAAAWATDERLTGGAKVKPKLVAAALERFEVQAFHAADEAAEEAEKREAVRETAAFCDGKFLAELCFNPESGAPDFFVVDRETGAAIRETKLDLPGGLYLVPASAKGICTPGGNIEGAILLPTERDEAGEDEEALRRDIRAFIARYVELPNTADEIAANYVFLTWCFDGFDELPYLRFKTADAGRGKSRALETVGALCYRPMFAGGGSSAAATLRLLDCFGGTLVADEFDTSHATELAAELTRILNQGFQRNRPLIKCDGESNTPRPFRCFGPKIFASRKGFTDDATETRTITITMTQRTRGDIPINLPREQFDREALALRNRLLGWRVANVGRIKIDPAMADPDLEDRFNQIGLPLLAVARTPAAREAILQALKEQQGVVADKRAESLAGEVLEAALAVGEAGDEVRPGDVANELNRRRAAAEGVEPDRLRKAVTAHRIGGVLREELELPRVGKGNRGALYRLDPARLGLLCRRFGMPLPQTSLTSQRHSSPQTSPGNPVFWPENAESDVSDVRDVRDDGGGDRDCTGGESHCPDDPADHDFDDGPPVDPDWAASQARESDRRWGREAPF